MTCTLYDRQHSGTLAYSGMPVESAEEVESFLRRVDGETAFIVELIASAGERLMIGAGAPVSFVQYTGKDGIPPYLCAVANPMTRNDDVEFLIGDTPTPIPAQFCIPFEGALEIAKEFCSSGKRSEKFRWVEI